VGDAQLRALVHDFPEQIERHDALRPVHLVSRAEDAFGVAEIRTLDLHDFRKYGGPVASGGQEQPSHRLRLLPQRGFDSAAGACLETEGVRAS
jgi:hypothetical protein